LIAYVYGDATDPPGPGPRIIAHVCNDLGRWGGKGFVVALSRRWKAPEEAYRRWPGRFSLGAVQLVPVAEALWVANLVAQHRVTVKSQPAEPPVRRAALRQCLERLTQEARTLQASVHLPRAGTGLALGRWEELEPLLLDTLAAGQVPVTVYDGPLRLSSAEPPPG
jgi:O-acetyl-ADP-ribose deacetylase (regulator of RNase III)